MALTKLITDLIDGSLGTDWDSNIKTAAFTAEAGKGYFVNTTTDEITVTLPVGTVGDEIVIQDYAGTFATNKVVFASNGSENIQGSTDDFKCIINNSTVTLIYQDATKGWTADNIETNILLVDYLVVAGGGSGSSQQFNSGGGGGGGAGGLRTSYGDTSGGGGSAEGGLTPVLSTNYTVTIGAGGVAPATGNVNGNDGNDSTFATITSTGGGGGGFATDQGRDGGSGGGGAGSGTTNQGYDGGQYNLGGGGGGGAAQAGETPTDANGGDGGDGLAVSITGTSITYAGGGGGGSYNTPTGGTGGAGGGGAGGGDGTAGLAGTSNTGGGGGTSGGAFASGFVQGSSGGSGIVILRYPNSLTITIGSGLTGATTTDGTDKVTTFTAGTGNISFS